MKLSIVIFFILISSFPAFCQTGSLQEGNKCFDRGDYTCAITKYEEALRSVNGRDKQIAEINLGRSKTCSNWLKTANQYFNQGKYKLAKENYQNVLNENPNDIYSKSQLEECDELLNVETTLSVSKTYFTFPSESGTQVITVNTNADTYSISYFPSWFNIQKNADNFIITFNKNTGSIDRGAKFYVKANDKVVEIEIKQASATQIDKSVQQSVQKKQKTSLSVSRKEYSFLASPGESLPILVSTTENEYLATTTSPWLSIKSYTGYLIISSKRNNANDSRFGVINIKSGDANASIKVFQKGLENTLNPSNSYTSTNKRKCFNCPQTRDSWGLTFGYSQIVFDPFEDLSLQPESAWEGFQFGLRFNPLFKGGFGLNTGIYFEAHTNNSILNSKYDQYSLGIPLHFEYHLNFSKWFSLFTYGGPRFSLVVANSFYEQNALPAILDFGGGIRVNRIQFNIGKSLNMGSFRDMSNVGKDVETYQDLVLAMSFMF